MVKSKGHVRLSVQAQKISFPKSQDTTQSGNATSTDKLSKKPRHNSERQCNIHSIKDKDTNCSGINVTLHDSPSVRSGFVPDMPGGMQSLSCK